MKKNIRLLTFSIIVTLAALLASCSSVPESIPEDLDADQLIQLGQDNFDAHHYKAAELYFNAVLERFGDDAKHYVEAKYELGHLFLRQKKYQAAYNNFTDVLEIYENVPVGLPGAYKILCNIELEKIPENKLLLPGSESESEQQDDAAEEPAQNGGTAFQESDAESESESELANEAGASESDSESDSEQAE